MSQLTLRSRLTGIDNDAKHLIFQAIRNGQVMTMADAFETDKFIRTFKRENAWKDISFFRDFSTVPSLNPIGGPKITFSRASGATRINQQGLIEYAPENLFTNSEEFNSANWLPGGDGVMTVTPNLSTAPNDTQTADQLIGGFTSAGRALYQNQAVINTRFTLSVWMKTNAGTRTMRLFINDNEVVKDITVTTTWQRFSLTGTVGNALSGGGRCGFRNLQTLDATNHVFVWGAQLERGSSMREYNPTTSSTYHAPRFDYNPISKSARGLLIEESRTNYIPSSESLLGNFSTSNVSFSSDVGTAPDGNNTADSITENTADGGHNANKTNIALSPQQTMSFSVFVKAGGCSRIRLRMQETSVGNSCSGRFNLLTGEADEASNFGTGTGAFVQMVAFPNGWYRCVLTGRPSTNTGSTIAVAIDLADDTGNTSYVGNGIRNILVWGIQVEAGAFPTSYIPTAGSAVTRAADVAQVLGNDFLAFYKFEEGSIFGETNQYLGAVNNIGLGDFILDPPNKISIRTVGQLVDVGASSQANIPCSSSVQNVIGKRIFAYRTNDFAGSTNGILDGTDSSGLLPTPIRFDIGRRDGNAYFNGYIRKIVIFNQRLPNSTLQVLTS